MAGKLRHLPYKNSSPNTKINTNPSYQQFKRLQKSNQSAQNTQLTEAKTRLLDFSTVENGLLTKQHIDG